jgi:predicted N-acyltransferase
MTRTATIEPAMAGIDAAAWDDCANPDAARTDPFVSHAFLQALEDSGSVGPGTGWLPRHLVLGDGAGGIAAVMPLYAKSHSQGEYVFDHSWADAYQRAGGRYYPKLICAVPFTPVPGRRLLVRPGSTAAETEALLAAAAEEVTVKLGCSSLHVTFLTEGEWGRLGDIGFLQRTGVQYHWQNEGYGCFDDFLATLASRKRKQLRRERAEALAGGIEIEHLTGTAITEEHWDTFFSFYMDTGSRKWGRPYLNRAFFSLLGAAMADRCLLVLAKRHGQAIAGALNMIGGDCLYGRYWGASEHVPFLHFEVCYYQAIDYAIAHGLARVEAGAQGEHKLIRGYRPVPTYSAHWIADPRLAAAVAPYLVAERAEIAETIEVLDEHGPYRRG